MRLPLRQNLTTVCVKSVPTSNVSRCSSGVSPLACLSFDQIPLDKPVVALNSPDHQNSILLEESCSIFGFNICESKQQTSQWGDPKVSLPFPNEHMCFGIWTDASCFSMPTVMPLWKHNKSYVLFSIDRSDVNKRYLLSSILDSD